MKFDITLWITIVQALILTFILNSILIKPIMRTLEGRRAKFEGLKSEIDELSASAEKALKDYERGLAEARAKAQAEREALRAQGREEEKKILEAAMKEAEAYKEKALKELQAQLESVRKTLLGQVEVFSKAVAEKVLGRAV